MNKKYVLNDLKNKLNIDDKTANIIVNIAEQYSIIGKKNKNNMVNEFINQLNIDEKTANNYYETLSSIIMNGLKEKIQHPFRNLDKKEK